VDERERDMKIMNNEPKKPMKSETEWRAPVVHIDFLNKEAMKSRTEKTGNRGFGEGAEPDTRGACAPRARSGKFGALWETSLPRASGFWVAVTVPDGAAKCA
jgi:hypothetical protein